MRAVRADEVAEDEILRYRGGVGWGSHAVAAKKGPVVYDMHYPLELGILLKGRVRRYYPEWETELGPGQAWLCGVWEQHGRVVLETPSERLALFVLPTALMRVGVDMRRGVNWMLPFRVPPEQRPQAHGRVRDQLLALGHRAAAKVSDMSDPQRDAWSLIIAMELLLTLCKGWEPPRSKGTGRLSDHMVLDRAVEMVFSSTGMVTAQAAAKACGMNRNTFSAVFKWFTGISFPKFALRYRISSAAQQLQSTNDPVKAVARDWGFAHVGHLHRCFVQHYGCSPVAYRKSSS